MKKLHNIMRHHKLQQYEVNKSLKLLSNHNVNQLQHNKIGNKFEMYLLSLSASHMIHYSVMVISYLDECNDIVDVIYQSRTKWYESKAILLYGAVRESLTKLV